MEMLYLKLSKHRSLIMKHPVLYNNYFSESIIPRNLNAWHCTMPAWHFLCLVTSIYTALHGQWSYGQSLFISRIFVVQWHCKLLTSDQSQWGKVSTEFVCYRKRKEFQNICWVSSFLFWLLLFFYL